MECPFEKKESARKSDIPYTSAQLRIKRACYTSYTLYHNLLLIFLLLAVLPQTSWAAAQQQIRRQKSPSDRESSERSLPGGDQGHISNSSLGSSIEKDIRPQHDKGGEALSAYQRAKAFAQEAFPYIVGTAAALGVAYTGYRMIYGSQVGDELVGSGLNQPSAPLNLVGDMSNIAAASDSSAHWLTGFMNSLGSSGTTAEIFIDGLSLELGGVMSDGLEVGHSSAAATESLVASVGNALQEGGKSALESVEIGRSQLLSNFPSIIGGIRKWVWLNLPQLTITGGLSATCLYCFGLLGTVKAAYEIVSDTYKNNTSQEDLFRNVLNTLLAQGVVSQLLPLVGVQGGGLTPKSFGIGFLSGLAGPALFKKLGWDKVLEARISPLLDLLPGVGGARGPGGRNRYTKVVVKFIAEIVTAMAALILSGVWNYFGTQKERWIDKLEAQAETAANIAGHKAVEAVAARKEAEGAAEQFSKAAHKIERAWTFFWVRGAIERARSSARVLRGAEVKVKEAADKAIKNAEITNRVVYQLETGITLRSQGEATVARDCAKSEAVKIAAIISRLNLKASLEEIDKRERALGKKSLLYKCLKWLQGWWPFNKIIKRKPK